MWVKLPDSGLEIRLVVIYSQRDKGKKGVFRETTVRALTGPKGDEFRIAEGVSSCSPQDVFSRLTGRKEACRRMLDYQRERFMGWPYLTEHNAVRMGAWSKRDRRAIYEVVCAEVAGSRPPVESPKEKFARLKERLTQKALPNYMDAWMQTPFQKIVGMGPAVLPFILRDLTETGWEGWVWALYTITDENPYPPAKEAGEPQAMPETEAWLQWGRKKGYHLPKKKTEEAQNESAGVQ